MGFLKARSLFPASINFFSTTVKDKIMKYLCVAEKNDAAKNIAQILSRGQSQRREGPSPYNKIYEFDCQVLGEHARIAMTSVSGHLLNYEFISTYKNWEGCHPSVLFEAPVVKRCPADYERTKKNLEKEIRSCQGLIIWTDCDREGENIGFEVIKVCTDIKPNIRVYRAKFSEITFQSVFRALNTLGQPNSAVSDAVDVRQELDLRTGAAFTRLQTLRLQKVFPQKLADKLISYGSCQFPTLGFVVERYQAIEDFIPEPFWKIKMNHTVKDLTTDFLWKRDRLFNKNSCEAILDHCQENPQATVENVESKPKSKWRPLPLDTVEMEKLVSKKLKINAKEAMKIAERLYTQGFISYPRTETNIFPKELNLRPLVEQQANDQNWGPFAQRILNEGGPTPRQGKKSDQAHPPIHPIKYTNTLNGNDQRLYEFIVRHFLACCHKDAEGFETIVNVDIADEKFTAKGLIVLEKNYLEVYIYERWNAKEINNYQTGDTFMPSVLEMVEGSTTAPNLLTEADLIALMEKHGIGTDATHAEHIETIKSREYVGLHNNIYFVPGMLGMGLVEGYNQIGLEVSLAKPNLRAEFENDLKLICEGRKDPEVVRREQIEKYKAVFMTVAERMRLIDDSLANRLEDRPQNYQEPNVRANMEQYKPALKCPKCGNDMIIRTRKEGLGKFVSCVGFPDCKNAIWLPSFVENVEVLDENCPECGPDYKKLKMKFRQNPFPGDPNPTVLCIGGCDENVLHILDISRSSVQRTQINRPQVQNNVQNNVQQPQMNRPAPQNNHRPNNDNSNNHNSNSPRTGNNNRFPNNSTNQQTFDFAPGPSTSRNDIRNSFGGNTSRHDDIVCQCNNAALLLTVGKDGPNKGRQFYKCPNNSCNFFLWASEANPAANATANNQTNDEVKCNCRQPAVLRTVQKQGANTGRRFYCCSKQRADGGCNFFQWADEGGGGGAGGGGDGWGGGGGGGGGGGWENASRGRGKMVGRGKRGGGATRPAPYKKDGPPTQRKCGLCREPGHQRQNCPNAR